MGSAGFVGQIAAYGAMLETGMSSKVALIQIIIMHFVLPAVVTLIFSEGMRKAGWIKDGDMKLGSIKSKNLKNGNEQVAKADCECPFYKQYGACLSESI